MNAVLESPTAGVTLIIPADPLSGQQATQFRRWMESALPDVRQVILDLSRVEFMDSAGCGVLLWLHKELLQRGGRLTVRGVVSSVQAMFDILRIERVLHILPPASAAG